MSSDIQDIALDLSNRPSTRSTCVETESDEGIRYRGIESGRGCNTTDGMEPCNALTHSALKDCSRTCSDTTEGGEDFHHAPCVGDSRLSAACDSTPRCICCRTGRSMSNNKDRSRCSSRRLARHEPPTDERACLESGLWESDAGIGDVYVSCRSGRLGGYRSVTDGFCVSIDLGQCHLLTGAALINREFIGTNRSSYSSKRTNLRARNRCPTEFRFDTG